MRIAFKIPYLTVSGIQVPLAALQLARGPTDEGLRHCLGASGMVDPLRLMA